MGQKPAERPAVRTELDSPGVHSDAPDALLRRATRVLPRAQAIKQRFPHLAGHDQGHQRSSRADEVSAEDSARQHTPCKTTLSLP